MAKKVVPRIGIEMGSIATLYTGRSKGIVVLHTPGWGEVLSGLLKIAIRDDDRLQARTWRGQQSHRLSARKESSQSDCVAPYESCPAGGNPLVSLGCILESAWEGVGDRHTPTLVFASISIGASL